MARAPRRWCCMRWESGNRMRLAQQPRALLSDMPAGDLGVRLTVTGRQPGPRAQLARVLEPGDVADLGDDHRGQHRADAGQLLDHLVAAVTGQQAGDYPAVP